jgi:hypothetical protein
MVSMFVTPDVPKKLPLGSQKVNLRAEEDVSVTC